jgi:hypothetical protein
MCIYTPHAHTQTHTHTHTHIHTYTHTHIHTRRPPATPLESVITNTFLNAHAHLFLTSEEQEAQQVEELAEQERYKREYMSRLRNNKRGGNQTQVDPKPVRLR